MDIAAAAALLSQTANPHAGVVALKIAAESQAQLAGVLAQLAEAGKQASLPDHLGRLVNTTA